ncbi:MAG: ArsC family reductase, partial [Zoogloeaceae bacterium]|nr:ArsC family reductase [Zoogloeaceae bacterium]
MIKIYGIKNCETMKKAFAWLTEHGIAYDFHDYKKAGVDAETLGRWAEKSDWKTLVNTRGTTWRKLAPEEQALDTLEQAIALMVAKPSVIRRPIVEMPDGALIVGFDPARFEVLLA